MYKISRYNYYIPYKERIVYFNSLKGGLFSLSKEEHARMSELFEDLITFQIQYNSVFERFRQMGFITSDEVDELDDIRYRNRNEVFLDKQYKLIILPTLECNFRCWYCYEEHNTGHMEAETVEKVKAHIYHMIVNEKISALDLSWYGGEPLLYFEEVVYPISLYAKQLCEEHGIPFTNWATTNAYLIDPSMIKQLLEIQLYSYQITIDGDEKRHNKVRNVQGKPSFDRILTNVVLLCENIPDAYITLRLNYDNMTLRSETLTDIYDRIPLHCRNKIDLTFQRVWQTAEQVNEGANQTIDSLLQACKKKAYRNVDFSNKFKLGKCVRCYADRYYTSVVNFDGNVYKCTSENFDGTNSIGILGENGEIINKNHELLTKLFGRPNFDNARCLSCKHLPICLGPCMKRKLANYTSNNICYIEPMEVTPEKFIIELYENQIRRN